MPQALLSASQVASLAPQQQVAYMRALTPQQQADLQAQQQQMQIQANRQYMRQSVEKVAYCPVAGGSGTSATYSPGTTLVFDLPVVGSGYAKALLITYNLTVTPATGSSATYAVNAAAPWNIFQELQLVYNGAQVRTHPYVFKLLDQCRGFSRGERNRVLAGNNDGTIAAQVVGSTPLVVNSGNTWQGKMLLQLNPAGHDTVPGCLPVMGVGNKPQLKLSCASSFMGADPLINPVATTGGTSASVAATGTITVDMVYLDGTNMSSPAPLHLSIAGEPTMQYYWDTALNPLNSGLVQRQHVSTLLEHWYMFSLVIDGVQSTQFSTIGNLTGFQLSPDSVGQQTFVNYNISNNVSVYDYYDRMRRMLGQDLDAGVIVWVAAPTRGVLNSSNRNGIQVLNMRAGGYPATTHGYQVTSTSSSTITPRVETFLISMNYDGLRIS